MKTKDKAIKYTPAQWVAHEFGSQAALAKAIDLSQAAVSQWGKRGGLIPPWAMVRILEIARDKNLDIDAYDLIEGRLVRVTKVAK